MPASVNAGGRIVFATLRSYRAAWLSGDLVAGIVLVAIAIPEQLATAKLAGFPPEAGLYAFAAGTLAFAALGANRYVSVGADSTVAPIFAASLGALGVAGSAGYYGLACLLALVVGAILLIVGLVRGGWLADLLSVPVTTGFLAGIAVHIIVGQLPSLFGVPNPNGSLPLRLVAIVESLGRANGYACALGVAVLAVTMAGSRISERIPGALIGLVGAGIAVATLGLRERGVAVLGSLSVAVPHVRLPAATDASRFVTIVPLALVVAAVCVLQSSAVVRSFPSETSGSDDVDRDFLAIGCGNVLAGLFGAFPVNASPPRTALVEGAGGRTQLSGIVAVAALVVVVAFCSRYAAYVPEAALAGVLIFVGLRLFRLHDFARIARYGRWEFGLALAAATLVVVLPIQTGMLLAIMLSLVHGVTLVMWPSSTQLFNVRGSSVWWPPTGERDVVDVPGIVVFAPAAPVNFTNAEFVRGRLFDTIARAARPVTLCVIEASGVTDIDYTGSAMLQAAVAELEGKEIRVYVARLISGAARESAARSGLLEALGNDRVFHSVAEAIDAHAALRATASPAGIVT